MEDKDKKILIVGDGGEDQRRRLAELVARHGSPKPELLTLDADPKPEGVTIQRHDCRHGPGRIQLFCKCPDTEGNRAARAKLIKRMARGQGQGPRKAISNNVAAGDEVQIRYGPPERILIARIVKAKKDGHLRVRSGPFSLTSAEWVTINGWHYRIAWQKFTGPAGCTPTEGEYGLAPGKVPAREPENFGLPDEGIPGVLLPKDHPAAKEFEKNIVHCKTPEDVRREFGPTDDVKDYQRAIGLTTMANRSKRKMSRLKREAQRIGNRAIEVDRAHGQALAVEIDRAHGQALREAQPCGRCQHRRNEHAPIGLKAVRPGAFCNADDGVGDICPCEEFQP